MAATKVSGGAAKIEVISLTNGVTCSPPGQIPELNLKSTRCEMILNRPICCGRASLVSSEFNQCWRYDFGNNTWTEVATFLCRRFAGGVLDMGDGRMWYEGEENRSYVFRDVN